MRIPDSSPKLREDPNRFVEKKQLDSLSEKISNGLGSLKSDVAYNQGVTNSIFENMKTFHAKMSEMSRSLQNVSNKISQGFEKAKKRILFLTFM